MTEVRYITLKREHFQVKETIVTIISEKKIFIEEAKKEIIKKRNEIEEYIRKNEFFEITFNSYNYNNNDPEIIKKMCISSKKFNIGPMSTVAGIIAEYAVKAMVSKGAKYAIVDNGGDIAIFSDRTVNVGIYTGNQKTSDLAFQIPPSKKIFGICTSSGKIGHSFSFGNTDAVTVFSENLSLADAAATILGNLVNKKRDIEKAFRILEDIREISGAMIILDNKFGLWGKIPRIVPANVTYDLITKGW
jgi:ApbE superfamily uncharacterized protein (UPF0280 family)